MCSSVQGLSPKSNPSQGNQRSQFTLVPSQGSSRFLNNHTIGSFRIPSILLYDYDGTFRGVKCTVDDEEAENFHQVRWY